MSFKEIFLTICGIIVAIVLISGLYQLIKNLVKAYKSKDKEKIKNAWSAAAFGMVGLIILFKITLWKTVVKFLDL